MDELGLLAWYWEMPVVTRGYLTACTLSTLACALELITPFHLYYNWHAILQGGQAWRLVTNFLFFGSWGIDFLFHMYFLVNYCRKLEESSFAGRSADFLFCLGFGMAALMAIAPWYNLMFYGSSLSFMLVYLFSRHHPGMQVMLLGILPFTAPYLPWVLLAFSTLLGQSVTQDLLGLAVGHAYFVLEDVYPALATARGWWITRLLPNPSNIAAGVGLLQASVGRTWARVTGGGVGVETGVLAAQSTNHGDVGGRGPIIQDRALPERAIQAALEAQALESAHVGAEAPPPGDDGLGAVGAVDEIGPSRSRERQQGEGEAIEVGNGNTTPETGSEGIRQRRLHQDAADGEG